MKLFLRRAALLLIIASVLGASLGTSAAPLVEKAMAAGCAAPSISFGRWKWCGYWYSKYQDPGTFVRAAGVPASVNIASAFINMITGDMISGDPHREAGAKFVILTMIGAPLPAPQAPGSPKVVTGAQYNDWLVRMNNYANIGQNGVQSWGTNGRIDWFSWVHLPCGTYNTYYQPTWHDVAPYIENAGNSGCAGSGLDELIIFRDNAGNPIYQIRRICMNPIGNLLPLANTPPPNYSVQPTINTTVNGGASTIAEVGDTVSFTYTSANNGTTPSVATTCAIYGNNRPGYVVTPGTPTGSSSGGYAPPPTTCPPAMAGGGSFTSAVETVVVASGNVTLCRSFFVQPATPAGLNRGVETCIPITNKPYLKVYGGDVMAGSGLETALDSGVCTNNPNAAVVSWNKDAAPYAGAGAQYAVTALRTISHFASGQITGAATTVPHALSFANTTANLPSANYGGTFGAAPCIKDFYATMPTAPTPIGDPLNVSPLTTGSYARGTNLAISGGNVSSGEQMTVYAAGNVFITGNITYPGNWTYDKIPMFRLVARGNIYIAAGVTQLDGIFISQMAPSGAGGTIFTCATGMSAIPLTGSYYSTCNNKLTINGAFVANSVQFLRTRGSQGQATPAEASSAANIAEVFNYSPALWIPQPNDGGTTNDYDSITSLPPVL